MVISMDCSKSAPTFLNNLNLTAQDGKTDVATRGIFNCF